MKTEWFLNAIQLGEGVNLEPTVETTDGKGVGTEIASSAWWFALKILTDLTAQYNHSIVPHIRIHWTNQPCNWYKTPFIYHEY